MKKYVVWMGAISLSLSSLGFLFKNMHWPGAGVMLVLGIALFALFFIPVLARLIYTKI